MIGLTLGIITLSTLNDDTSTTITSGIFQAAENATSTSPTPVSSSSSITGGQRKTPKKHPKQQSKMSKNKTHKSK
jgi:hypothetical protein